METFAYQLQNLPELNMESLKYFCTNFANYATQRKYDPFTNSLYVKFDDYDTYNDSYQSTKATLKDSTSGIELMDMYEYRMNSHIEIVDSLSIDQVISSVRLSYSGNKNIVKADQSSFSFMSDEDIVEFCKELIAEGSKVVFTFTGSADNYHVYMVVYSKFLEKQDDSHPHVISIYSKHYLKLLNKVKDNCQDIDCDDCINQIEDLINRRS